MSSATCAEVSNGGYSFRMVSRVCSRAAARSIAFSAIGETLRRNELINELIGHRK
jgi:hypothetical protein